MAKIRNVALTSATHAQNKTLNARDVVTVTVDFNAIVDVAGKPFVLLNIGGDLRRAYYAYGSGSKQLAFTYTIKKGLTDLDGISLQANGLKLNGGHITDAANHNAALRYATVADNANYKVDTTAPIATLKAAVLSNKAAATVHSNETGKAFLVKTGGYGAVNVTNLASITHAADAKWNSISVKAGVDTKMSLKGLQNGIYTLYTTDAAGNLSQASAKHVTVDNIPPNTTLIRAEYNTSTGELVLTGTHFDKLGSAMGKNIKYQLDWSKLVWDTNGDNDLTANKSFTVRDIDSAIVNSASSLTITLKPAAKASLENMIGFGSAGGLEDKLDITAGFIRDKAGNRATTDGLVNGTVIVGEPASDKGSVTVYDTQSLRTAINNARDGTTIYIVAGEYERINITGKSNLTLLAADPNNKPHIQNINMTQSQDIAISNIVFGASQFDPATNVLIGINASYIQGLVLMGVEVMNSRDAIGIRYSSDVEILQSYLHDNERDGIITLDVDNITISDNVFTAFHPNYENYLYQDWYYNSNGTAYLDAELTIPADHADFIQLTNSDGITITGNTLDATGGAWTQSIFIHAGHHLAPVVIEDNAIKNGHIYGIKVYNQENVEQQNNILTQVATNGIAGIDPRFAPKIDIVTYDHNDVWVVKDGERILVNTNDSHVTTPPGDASEVATQVVEGNTNQTHYFLLTLDHAYATDISIDYTTRDGTAVAGEDYIATSGTAVILSGETCIPIAVDLIGDTIAENNETFSMLYSNLQGISPDAITLTDTHTILDDDANQQVAVTGIIDYGA